MATTLQIEERKAQLTTMRNSSLHRILSSALIYGAEHRVYRAKIGQQVLLSPPNDAVGSTPFELESVDWPRSTMRPIAVWCTFTAVYGEAQEHGQLVLGVESRYTEHDATLCIFICLHGRALSE
jgi:hypothetical protein